MAYESYENYLERSKTFYRKIGGALLILFGFLCFLISILLIFDYVKDRKEYKLVKESIADKYDRKVDANVGRWVKVTYRNGIEIKRKHLKRDEIEELPELKIEEIVPFCSIVIR